MTAWRLAASLIQLRKEVDAAWPDRPKGADGTIGDARHQAEKSDHNPTDPHPGVVTAWDITTDPRFTDALSEWLRERGPTDGRVKYVIFKGRICSSKQGWEWRPYSGFSQHFDHIHLSVSDQPSEYDRTDPWHPFDVHAADTAKPTPVASRPFHAGMAPHNHYPDIATIRARFKQPTPAQGADFFDDGLSAFLRAFAKSRGLAYDRHAITVELWNEIWK